MRHLDENNRVTLRKEEGYPFWLNTLARVIWMIAVAVVFLPIALYTSPWDAVRFRVPDNQGNWWHFLIGMPYLLAFPMAWLRLRSLFSKRLSTPAGRRFIWTIVLLSICGTILVEVPFILRLGNLSRMNNWRWLSIVCPTLGILIASGALLLFRRRNIPPTRACLVGLSAAYLANAALCLIVYGPMPGTARSKFGWIVTMVIVWPMLLELLWLFIKTFKARVLQDSSLVESSHGSSNS